ncbi:MAG: AsmA-like C-terminal region-containing protein, partial [Deltaproteobacteria bacterium]
DGMQLAGRVTVHDVRAHPEILALDLRATELRLERVIPFLPAGMVPPHAHFEGPVDLEATAGGSPGNAQLDARLDLSAATITLPALLKPAGSPFSVEFHGHAAGTHVDIARMGVVLGPLHLLLHGTVDRAETADLTFDSGSVALEGLLPFLPSVRHDLAGRASLHGTARLEGRVRRARHEDVLHLGLTLRGAQIVTDALRLEGDADARADARLEHGRQSLVLDLDATRATITAGSRIDKPAGVTLRLHADVQRGPHRAVNVRALTLDTQGLQLEGAGSFDPSRHHFDARCTACDIDAAALTEIAPVLRGRLAVPLSQAVLRATFTADGDPAAPGDANVHASALAFTAPYGALHGRIDVEGLQHPRRLAFDLDVDRLDLDAIEHTGTVRPGAVPAARPASSSTSDALSVSRDAQLNDIVIDGRLHAREVTRGDSSFAAVELRVTARDGNLDFPTLRFRYADGTVDLSHSRWQLTERHRLDVHVRAVGLDLEQLGRGGDADRRATGRIDVDTDFTGSTEDADVQRTFLGAVHLTGRNMVVRRVVTPVLTIDHPLLARFSLRLGPREGSNEPRQPLAISSLDARLRLDGGVLRTIAPVVADTEVGRFEVDGSASLDGALDLRGTVHIAPDEIWRQSNHRLLPPAPVPVHVRITGQTDEPHVLVVDLGATIQSLLGSSVRA